MSTPETSLIDKAASSVPSSSLNKQLLQSFQTKKLSTFLASVKACNQKLNLGADAILDQVSNLPIDKRWSPGIHVLSII
jgi:hypothetical protein